MPQLEILLQQFAKTSPPLITARFLIYFNILIYREKKSFAFSTRKIIMIYYMRDNRENDRKYNICLTWTLKAYWLIVDRDDNGEHAYALADWR